MTEHKIFYKNAIDMSDIKDNTIDLMITSPPYPMVEMWDTIFADQNKDLKKAIENNNGNLTFELMHKELDKVWKETYRVLKPGGLACINIGDATRTIGGDFKLYNSHSRITNYCINLGFNNLPNIIWHKQTNSPNKFMGSGMLPPGAYVTLEHELILIFRKGTKRPFNTQKEKDNRSESAYFWEERNIWFSDIWNNLKGTKQDLEDKKIRDRSGAYPFELTYRLINMFSVKGDYILDPFLGTGTTTIASISSERNSIGYEIDSNFSNYIDSRILGCKDYINKYITERIDNHFKYIKDKQMTKDKFYENDYLKCKVITRQEQKIKFKLVNDVNLKSNNCFIKYIDY